ncbi:MAG: hypothetical protein EOO77_16595 [Oxalobacteraceae bacterium]|nr:MAG: hypothetical protein EOO77_16595 [Oxalobacteraceae bacterium]
MPDTFVNRSLNSVPVHIVDDKGAPLNGATTVDTTSSGTIATTGTVVTVTFTGTRQEIINASTAPFWCRWNATPAVNGAGSFPINPGGAFDVPRVNGVLMVMSTINAQTYTVNRYSA